MVPVERAKRQIELGRRTGADGGGVSPNNIYVIAAELLARIATLEWEREKADAEVAHLTAGLNKIRAHGRLGCTQAWPAHMAEKILDGQAARLDRPQCESNL
jgi:hypothetical protein